MDKCYFDGHILIQNEAGQWVCPYCGNVQYGTPLAELK